MGVFKRGVLFLVGGSGYVALEYLWRGWSHWSMFLAGGFCFLLLGRLSRLRLSLVLRGILGAGIITATELLAGLLVNRQYTVWDYRAQPFNFRGQICLPFCLLWIPVSIGAMWLYRLVNRWVRL